MLDIRLIYRVFDLVLLRRQKETTDIRWMFGGYPPSGFQVRKHCSRAGRARTLTRYPDAAWISTRYIEFSIWCCWGDKRKWQISAECSADIRPPDSRWESTAVGQAAGPVQQWIWTDPTNQSDRWLLLAHIQSQKRNIGANPIMEKKFSSFKKWIFDMLIKSTSCSHFYLFKKVQTMFVVRTFITIRERTICTFVRSCSHFFVRTFANEWKPYFPFFNCFQILKHSSDHRSLWTSASCPS